MKRSFSQTLVQVKEVISADRAAKSGAPKPTGREALDILLSTFENSIQFGQDTLDIDSIIYETDKVEKGTVDLILLDLIQYKDPDLVEAAFSLMMTRTKHVSD